MIPDFEPSLGDEEVDAVADAIRRGEISGSFGIEIEAYTSFMRHTVVVADSGRPAFPCTRAASEQAARYPEQTRGAATLGTGQRDSSTTKEQYIAG